jgi:diguanylate cyclase
MNTARASEDQQLGVLVRGELMDQYRRLMSRGLIATPFSTPFVYLVTRHEARTRHIFIWIIFAFSIFTVNMAMTVTQRRFVPERIGFFSVPAFLIGLVWGALPYVVDPAHPVAQAILILILVAVCAVATVMNAPSQLGFFSMITPIVVLGGSYLHSANDQRLQALAPVAGLLFVVMTLIHHEVNHTIKTAIGAKVANDLLLDQLHTERQKIETANSALMRANRQLNHRATHDPLTGLLNRAALVDRLDSLVAKSRPGAGVAVMYLDLDRFKLINDSLGHHIGDELLKAVSQRCVDALPDTCIARLGGDEFCVVMYPVSSADDAMLAANRLRIAIDQPTEISGRPVSAPVSIGVAIGFGDVTPNDLQRFADVALYQAKDGGRNQISLFNRAMRDTMDQVIDQGTALRAAVNSKLIVPWYQPEINLVTGEMIGAEALARWITPTGVVGAGAFMPIAEQVGLYDLISDEIMTAAMTARHRWHRAGIDPNFRLRVNVTAQQLTSDIHVHDFLSALTTHNIPASGVSLEITETSVIRDVNLVSAGLQRVRAAGVTVALDDFGTGHSSLSLLQVLPIDAVKIDRSFISDLATDSRDRALVKSVIALASELGLTVTGEGVETIEQADILRDMGCNSAQGFWYAPALPDHELLLRMHRPTGPRPTTLVTLAAM